MSPRPILKCSQHPTLASLPPPPVLTTPFPFSSCVVLSPHVRFAPTPTLTFTYTLDQDYDRAPIAISPNACSMPSRGERVYQSNSPQHSPCPRGRSTQVKGSYFHPRAFEACTTERSVPRPMSPLHSPSTPELSFSSSESSSDSDSSLPASPIPPAGMASNPCRVYTPGFGHNASRCRSPSPSSDPKPHRRPRPKRPNTMTSDSVRTPMSQAVVTKRRRSIPLNFNPPSSSAMSSSDLDSSCLGGF
ncbi:hypothetical protein BDV98DRAFT_158509 [Pterulicium gracile]|uniref:Uncharacterized protein n=1 Tax=Pterulicium gracile TaxID=1884261 RepID=A0A5C3R0K5_9AGAR|nr:hypothetical protein BDV98DRAFT_158509 [Pterula gracilis]